MDDTQQTFPGNEGKNPQTGSDVQPTLHEDQEQNTQPGSDDQSLRSPASGTGVTPPTSPHLPLPRGGKVGSGAGQTFTENENKNGQARSDDQTVQPSSGSQQVAPLTELEQARQQAEDYLNGWKRAQADYQNLKRDMEKEKVELAKFTSLSLLLELLPVLDNFGRAIKHLPEEKKNDEWVKGVLAIHQQFLSLMTSMGVTVVPVDGMFNPELHEAVGNGDGENVPTGTILEVVQPGYTLYGKLIRPAKVRIAK